MPDALPVTAAELAASTISTAPAATHTAQPPASAPSPTAEKDSLGRAFDASKFRPEKDTFGRWKNVRGGRPKSGAPAASPAIPSAPGSFVAPEPERPSETVSNTVETAIGLIQTALVLIGQEEGVLSDQEKLLLRSPLERCVKKYDVGEMPAELDLAVALAVIVIARLKKPKTATFAAKARAWLGGMFARREGRKIASAIAHHAPMPEASPNS